MQQCLVRLSAAFSLYMLVMVISAARSNSVIHLHLQSLWLGLGHTWCPILFYDLCDFL